MRTLIIFSAIGLSSLVTGCQTMSPEQIAAMPAKQYDACRYVPNSPKCHGQSMSVREIEARKAYAADVLESEQRHRDATTRAGRDL